jgi:hypothetical protein
MPIYARIILDRMAGIVGWVLTLRLACYGSLGNTQRPPIRWVSLVMYDDR